MNPAVALGVRSVAEPPGPTDRLNRLESLMDVVKTVPMSPTTWTAEPHQTRGNQ